MESNLKALEIAANWTQENEDRMNAALNNTPATAMNMRHGYVPLPPRRKIAAGFQNAD